MGCCLTTTNRRRHNPPPQKSPPPPPPPAFEEKETVKEVLSETPLPLPQPQPEPETNNVVVLTKTNPPDEIQENVSDVSEMFSYSESYSAATTATKKEDEEEDAEVTQKLKNNRSPPPAKRVVRKRPVGERKTTRPPVRRQVAASQNGKSDRRDVSVRRSRSPAVRGEMGQRRKVVTGKSPVDEVAPVGDEKSTVKVDGGDTTELEVSESLENPLVSLECFIFL